MKIAIGIDDTKTNSRAWTAASAKNASDAVDHIDIASVSNPIGDNIIVAGNSFMVNINTRAPPANKPGRMIGIVIEYSTCIGPFPRLRAASSRRGLICRRDDLIEPTAAGRNRMI